jgi:hypothetical protein
LRRSQRRSRADLQKQRAPSALHKRLTVRFLQQHELFELDQSAREPQFKVIAAS